MHNAPEIVPTEATPYKVIHWFMRIGSQGYRTRLGILVILSILIAIGESISLWLIIPLLGSAVPANIEGNNIHLPGGSEMFPFFDNIVADITNLIGLADQKVYFVLLLMGTIVIAKCALQILFAWLISKCRNGLMANWANNLLAFYLARDLATSTSDSRGVMMSNITVESKIAAEGLKDIVIMLSQCILCIAYIALLFSTNWKVTLIQVAVIAALFSVLYVFANMKTLQLGTQVLRTRQALEKNVLETLNAMRQIKSAAIEQEALQANREIYQTHTGFIIRQFVLGSLPRPLSELFLFFMIAASVLFLFFNPASSFIDDLALIIVFLVVGSRLFTAAARIVAAYLSAVAAFPSLQTIATISRNPVNDVSTAPHSDENSVNLAVSDLELESVSYCYRETKKVLSNINIKIPANGTVVIKGPTGSGKSTLVNMLLGLTKPTSGSIKVGSTDMQSVNISAFRQMVGYVSQDTFLFNSSIRENFQIYNTKVSDDEILNACTIAQLKNVLEALPDGLDTNVGEFGTALSGGERQRLAVAIALINNPEFYLFDEITSAMDPTTEKNLITSLVAELAGKTLVFIAHQVPDGLSPDRIYEIVDGSVIFHSSSAHNTSAETTVAV